jgi:hypothetical protein
MHFGYQAFGMTLSPKKSEEILQEVRSLRKKVRQLTKEIESIRLTSIEDPSPVEKMLRMRGVRTFR